MAEEVKNEQQDDSTETADKVIEENPPADKEQAPQNAEGKSIDPEDQTFWEDSVDANSVDIAEGQTVHKEATEENQPADKEPEAEKEEETGAAIHLQPKRNLLPHEEAQEPDGDEKKPHDTNRRY